MATAMPAAPSTTAAVRVGDTELGSLSGEARTLTRRRQIGFVFQAYNLIPTLTAEENVTVEELDQTIVMVTDDPNAASYSDRVLFLAGGRIVDEMVEPSAERVLDRVKRFGD